MKTVQFANDQAKIANREKGLQRKMDKTIRDVKKYKIEENIKRKVIMIGKSLSNV